MRSAFSKYPFFLFLLPAFFVLHGSVENFGMVPARDAILLALFYAGIGLILFFLFLPLFKDTRKAGMMAALLLGYQFFFGSFHDFLKQYLNGSFIVRYSFLVPFLLLLAIITAVVLKKNRKDTSRLTFYLNSLLIILLLFDTGAWCLKSINAKKNATATPELFRSCPDCKKPDIYLLLADGYPGKQELSDLFHYDNSPFETELEKRGFHIIDSSTSNYNYTAFSVASLLDMNYLSGIRGNNNNKKDLELCVNVIKNNLFTWCLKENGYSFFNYSIFEFDGQPSYTHPTFLPQKTLPITSQTFTRRIARDLWYHLATTFRVPSVIKKYKNSDRYNTEKVYALTLKEAGKKRSSPKFIYTHLMMPHHPLYFDSSGRAYPLSRLVDLHYHNKQMRIGYLQYSNRKLLELCDQIINSSPEPPVILLMGDHGIREFKDPVETRYQFMTLNAILLPGRNYEGFYNGQTHVNHLRIFLNKQLNQNLPLLPDSSVLIKEYSD